MILYPKEAHDERSQGWWHNGVNGINIFAETVQNTAKWCDIKECGGRRTNNIL